MQQHYNLRMHLFEPSPNFFRELVKTLANSTHVSAGSFGTGTSWKPQADDNATPGFIFHNFGLGARTHLESFLERGEGSVVLHPTLVDKASNQLGEVLVRSAAVVVEELFAGGKVTVELLHMN